MAAISSFKFIADPHGAPPLDRRRFFPRPPRCPPTPAGWDTIRQFCLDAAHFDVCAGQASLQARPQISQRKRLLRAIHQTPFSWLFNFDRPTPRRKPEVRDCWTAGETIWPVVISSRRSRRTQSSFCLIKARSLRARGLAVRRRRCFCIFPRCQRLIPPAPSFVATAASLIPPSPATSKIETLWPSAPRRGTSSTAGMLSSAFQSRVAVCPTRWMARLRTLPHRVITDDRCYLECTAIFELPAM